MKKMSLTTKYLLSMLLGIIIGLIINYSGLNSEGSFVNEYIMLGLFTIIGKMFITLLKLLVVPLVLLSLISGVLGIGDISTLGKIGAKSFGLYILTTAMAIATAIGVALIIQPGVGANQISTAEFTAKEAPPLSDVLINIIPSNIFDALTSGNMLQIIFFAIFFGIALLMVGEKAKPIAEGIEILNEAMMNMVNMVMAVGPYAVFALMTKAVAMLGISMLVELGGYVFVVILALFIHLFFTLMIMFKFFTNLSPKILLKKLRGVQVFAFSTSSSNATIPVTLRALTQRVGVDNSVASFTVPFGATINMDGTAIMQGVATVFIANMYGIELGLSGYLTVIMMSILASIGTAGVPGVGLIMLSMVFTQVGLPVEGIAIILGVDRLLDMLRTIINVSGDATVSTIVANSEGKLDIDKFNNPEAGEEEIHISRDVENKIADAIHNTQNS
ncbi:Proton/glutamate symport protein @ Sodium/glutamate symport protein [hydrothermal vent metagenome]|uniref:Proton/glutamate symport protein @ Sodium/glutamate symport protein n=1 Tax=hydrothermal vent metagenome TaxID=652676 RepID=A0A1W1EL63_9ZZZZ